MTQNWQYESEEFFRIARKVVSFFWTEVTLTGGATVSVLYLDAPWRMYWFGLRSGNGCTIRASCVLGVVVLLRNASEGRRDSAFL